MQTRDGDPGTPAGFHFDASNQEPFTPVARRVTHIRSRAGQAARNGVRKGGTHARAALAHLTDRIIDIAPRIPVRDLATLRRQFPGLGPEQLADKLVAGAANGTLELARVLAEGAQAGRDAAVACGFEPLEVGTPDASGSPHRPLVPLWRVDTGVWPGRATKAFVDLQNDVTVADIFAGVREG